MHPTAPKASIAEAVEVDIAPPQLCHAGGFQGPCGTLVMEGGACQRIGDTTSHRATQVLLRWNEEKAVSSALRRSAIMYSGIARRHRVLPACSTGRSLDLRGSLSRGSCKTRQPTGSW